MEPESIYNLIEIIKYETLNELNINNIDYFLQTDRFGNLNKADVEDIRSLMKELEAIENYELCAYIKKNYLN